jgi:chromatin remodeling complex protein RSC6
VFGDNEPEFKKAFHVRGDSPLFHKERLCRLLEKRIPRELKKASKGRRNRKAADGTDKPKKESVFTKPSKISDELCQFLGQPKGTEMSRSAVTTAVCNYAKQKGLMEKQLIKADASLRKLLKLTEKDELKILNLQRYLKPHYIKATPTA